MAGNELQVVPQNEEEKSMVSKVMSLGQLFLVFNSPPQKVSCSKTSGFRDFCSYGISLHDRTLQS